MYMRFVRFIALPFFPEGIAIKNVGDFLALESMVEQLASHL